MVFIQHNKTKPYLVVIRALKVNTKTRYGIRAMVEIAKKQSEEGIYQKEISENQDISNKYLDHIIHGLKVARLIRENGKKGGYVLTQKPSEITVYDINNVFDPCICIIEHYKSTTLEDLIRNHEKI